MPNFLIGTSYAISAGLVLYTVQTNLAPIDGKFPLVILWAVAGLGLAFTAVLRGKKEA